MSALSEFLRNESMSDLMWTGLDPAEIHDIYKQKFNPLANRTKLEVENPGLRELIVMHDPDYFWLTCKVLFNIEINPIQQVCLEIMWNTPFPMVIGCRGFGKTFLLALYAMLKAVLNPGTNIVAAGAAYRQSRFVFHYMERIWNNCEILRSIFKRHRDGPGREVDQCRMVLGDSNIYCIPIGTGEKIRGLRANCVIADEFGSIPEEIFEVVFVGFTSVSQDPMEKVRTKAKRDFMKKMGTWTQKQELNYLRAPFNQLVISGTPGFEYGHFYRYFNNYRNIIQAKSNTNRLKGIFGSDYDQDINSNDFAVVRIPEELVPDGFLDKKAISRARVTLERSVFLREYGACFAKDSEGFFKRSMIDAASCSETSPVVINNKEVYFNAAVQGDRIHKCVMGVDPASEQDNFAIVVLELHEDHQRCVYCWTINRRLFKRRQNQGLTTEENYWEYCTRKIRNLMKTFNIVQLAIDSGGGGLNIEECLQDSQKLESGERCIYPMIDEKKERETDHKDGLHILEMVSFSNYEYMLMSNYSLKKDMEGKQLIFPTLNAVLLGLATESDKDRADYFKRQNPNKKFIPLDTLEDCMLEIEELKNELTAIVMVRSGNREKWTVPDAKTTKRQKKDRYSALIMANMAARMTQRTPATPEYITIGGVVGHMKKDDIDYGKLYHGPGWWDL